MTDPTEDAWDDDEEPDDAAALETEADVRCPHCGAIVSIELDPAGGRSQEYVQDCDVCCRPWQVNVWFDATGAAGVDLTPLE
jgi:hypothetical protein